MLLNDIMGPKIELTAQWKVFMYILEHTDGDTKLFVRTYQEIKDDTGVSEMTINKVFKIMQEIGCITKLGNSRWRVDMVEGYSDTCDGIQPFVVAKEPFKESH